MGAFMMCFIDSVTHIPLQGKGDLHLMCEAAVPLLALPKPLPELIGVFF